MYAPVPPFWTPSMQIDESSPSQHCSIFDLWMHTDRSNSIRSITCIAVCGDDFTLRRNDMHGEKIGFMLSTLHLLSALFGIGRQSQVVTTTSCEHETYTGRLSWTD